jgi:uncharacterized RDD family membrane protein YckC
MSVVTVTTPFNIDLEFRIAAFHKRLLAWFLDGLIMLAFGWMMTFLIPSLRASGDIDNALVYLLAFFPIYTYHFFLEWLLNGQTPGKMAMGIKVVDKTGKGVTLSQYLLRWMFRIVDISATMGAGAVLSIALSPFNQRLGDIVAGTIVIDNKGRTGIHETIFLDIQDEGYNVMFPQVMRLTDRDINGIRNLLDVKTSGRDNESYKEQVAERIRAVLNIEGYMEPNEFLQQLLADYNYLTRQ